MASSLKLGLVRLRSRLTLDVRYADGGPNSASQRAISIYEKARPVQTCYLPATAITDFLAPDILDKADRAVPEPVTLTESRREMWGNNRYQYLTRFNPDTPGPRIPAPH